MTDVITRTSSRFSVILPILYLSVAKLRFCIRHSRLSWGPHACAVFWFWYPVTEMTHVSVCQCLAIQLTRRYGRTAILTTGRCGQRCIFLAAICERRALSACAPAGRAGDTFIVAVADWTLSEGEGAGGIMDGKCRMVSTGIGRQVV